MSKKLKTDLDLSKTGGSSPPLVLDPKDWCLIKKFFNHRGHRLTGVESGVLRTYFENSNGYNSTLAQVANELGMKRGNVSRAFLGLRKKEILVIARHVQFGTGRKTPVYGFHHNFLAKFEAWKEQLHCYQRPPNSYHPDTYKDIKIDKEQYKQLNNNKSLQDKDYFLEALSNYIGKGQ